VGDESFVACGSVVPAQAREYWHSTPDKIQVKMPDETSSEFFLITFSSSFCATGTRQFSIPPSLSNGRYVG
jgi:hypothetical protein